MVGAQIWVSGAGCAVAIQAQICHLEERLPISLREDLCRPRAPGASHAQPKFCSSSTGHPPHPLWQMLHSLMCTPCQGDITLAGSLHRSVHVVPDSSQFDHKRADSAFIDINVQQMYPSSCAGHRKGAASDGGCSPDHCVHDGLGWRGRGRPRRR